MKNLFFISVWMFSMIMPFQTSSASPFAGGTGVDGDPWQIADATQLDSVRNYLSDSFILMDDIDLTGYLTESYNSGKGWAPIGSYKSDNSTHFRGVFDGNGHTVSGLWINNPTANDQGLFGWAQDGVLKNLTVVTDDAKGGIKANNCAAILCGSNGNNTRTGLTILNCTARGTVSGASPVGILTAASTGTIDGCKVSGTAVNNGYYNGGISGRANGTIKNCEAKNVTFINNHATTPYYTGGIVGAVAEWMATTIDSCTVDIIRFAGNRSGGIAGYFHYNNPAMVYIKNCSVSNITVDGNSNSEIGGLVGQADKDFSIEKCTVSNADLTADGGGQTGGLVGYVLKAGTITDCTVSEAKVAGSYSVGGFIGRTAMNGALAVSVSNCHVYDADVSCTGYIAGGFIGDANQGISISNCSVSGKVTSTAVETADANAGGFAGFMRDNYYGTIANCKAYVDVDVAQARIAGGFCGGGESTTGLIRDCRFAGKVTGKKYVGGFAGKARFKIMNSIAIAEVSGAKDNAGVSATGGFIGALNDAGNSGGYAQECYFSGKINGDDHTGGFIGLNNTAAAASAIVNCSAYADITVSGDTVGGFIGTAKTGGQEVKASFFYGTIDRGEAATAGSFIGSNEGDIPFSLSYAQEISGLNPAGDASSSAGITAVAEAGLKQKSSYSNDIFGSPYFMQMVDGKTWPYTVNQTAPFEITSLTATHLQGRLVDTGLSITLFKNYKHLYTGAAGEEAWSYTFPETLIDGDIITAIVNTETTLEDASCPVSQAYITGNAIVAVTPDEGLAVYPNPVADELYLKGTSLQEDETATISDLSGRTVLSTRLSILHPVKVSHLPQGVYLLHAGGKVVKLVKK